MLHSSSNELWDSAASSDAIKHPNCFKVLLTSHTLCPFHHSTSQKTFVMQIHCLNHTTAKIKHFFGNWGELQNLKVEKSKTEREPNQRYSSYFDVTVSELAGKLIFICFPNGNNANIWWHASNKVQRAPGPRPSQDPPPLSKASSKLNNCPIQPPKTSATLKLHSVRHEQTIIYGYSLILWLLRHQIHVIQWL